MILNNKIFRANDIRGKYPSEINEEIVFNIISGIKNKFRNSIVIGHDARLSSPNLYRAAIKGIMNNELRITRPSEALRRRENKKSEGIIHNSKFIIHEAGMITTPMLYFLVNKLKADGGIMVTASHNPKEYNGLKIVGKNAVAMGGEEIYKIIPNS